MGFTSTVKEKIVDFVKACTGLSADASAGSQPAIMWEDQKVPNPPMAWIGLMLYSPETLGHANVGAINTETGVRSFSTYQRQCLRCTVRATNLDDAMDYGLLLQQGLFFDPSTVPTDELTIVLKNPAKQIPKERGSLYDFSVMVEFYVSCMAVQQEEVGFIARTEGQVRLTEENGDVTVIEYEAQLPDED